MPFSSYAIDKTAFSVNSMIKAEILLYFTIKLYGRVISGIVFFAVIYTKKSIINSKKVKKISLIFFFFDIFRTFDKFIILITNKKVLK